MVFSTALLTLSLGAAAASRLPAVTIALVLDPRLPASVGRLAVAEAAAIWKPYGVAIVAPAAPNPSPETGLAFPTLTVRIEPGAPDPQARSAPFAAVRFFDGTPEPTLLLYYEAITTLALTHDEVGGLSISGRPRALRDRLTARVIGRALAHEIGHWLLRTSTHSVAGLMRAAHPTSHLMAVHRQHFRLGPEDIVLLGEAVTRLSGGAGR